MPGLQQVTRSGALSIRMMCVAWIVSNAHVAFENISIAHAAAACVM